MIEIGAGALARWPQTRGGRAVLINLSENHTFRIDGPRDGARHMLRVHRPGYQNPAAIASELSWLDALRRDTALPVPRPLAGRDGALIQPIDIASEGATRLAVLFACEPGREPAPSEDLRVLFNTVGTYAAIAHRHVESWLRPPDFTRQIWSAAAVLDPDGLWGDWRHAPHVDGRIAPTLAALDRRLRADLAAYGAAPDRFGLIHADMRLANLLVDGGRVTLIDFDDCGFCWFVYDFAAAVSFFEDAPQVAALKRSWIEGYSAIRPLSAADIAAIDTMVLLRRMALLAWIGSHRETPLAQSHAPGFAAGTAALAEAYLS